MGVYIFRSLVDPAWNKVGHCKITARRPNVWYRVARRGFCSCICPKSLYKQTHVHQLELLAFYPSLTTKQEKGLHRAFKAVRTGEWYDVELLPKLQAWLEAHGGVDTEVPDKAKLQALCWAKKAPPNTT